MSLKLISDLIQAVGKDKVLSEEDLKERYDHIWRMDVPLKAIALTLPTSTQDVSEILKICHAANQPVVVHGGLTNLVGSTETNENELVISLEKMDAIEELDEQSRTMTVGAGVILENVQNAAKDKGLLFPLNYGAKGSAQMGGAISTNAGGLQVFRYGMTRNLILGIEAVLADGTIISGLKKIIKDNSGYDLKQLFIGSEGTLGVVTKAVLKLVEAPKSSTTAYVAFNEFDKIVEFMRFVDGHMAGTLSAFELIWKESFVDFTSPPSVSRPPLPYDYNYYVLFEGLGGDQIKDQELLENLLVEASENDLILDAAIAYGETDRNWFWSIRENVDNLVVHCTHDQHFDISMPISSIGVEIEKMIAKLKEIEGVERIYPFGHVADGNIHLIIGKSNTSAALKEAINQVVYSPLPALGGSISAEHGIGVHKKGYLHFSVTAAEIELMKTLKTAMDPKGILNPGKVIDL